MQHISSRYKLTYKCQEENNGIYETRYSYCIFILYSNMNTKLPARRDIFNIETIECELIYAARSRFWLVFFFCFPRVSYMTFKSSQTKQKNDRSIVSEQIRPLGCFNYYETILFLWNVDDVEFYLVQPTQILSSQIMFKYYNVILSSRYLIYMKYVFYIKLVKYIVLYIKFVEIVMISGIFNS